MRTTPLQAAHEGLSAKMVAFHGWWMPLQYPTGISEEHVAVRERVGIFDVSHMGRLRIDGADALPLLRWTLLNDAKLLRRGRAHYTMVPSPEGGLLDDAYVYHLARRSWLLVVNAANAETVTRHLQREAEAFGEVTVRDVTEDWAFLALQGPGAALLLERFVDVALPDVRKNDTLPADFDGLPVRLARTGYTGEDGFELFTRPADAESVWSALVTGGATPCGLGARDTLRLEAGFPLFGHELDRDTDPRCTPFAWVIKDKPHVGRDAWGVPHCPRSLVGLKMLGRGIARQGYRLVDAQGAEVGAVTSGTISPLTRDSLAFAWVDAALAEDGTEVYVSIRGQHVAAIVTKPPFLTS